MKHSNGKKLFLEPKTIVNWNLCCISRLLPISTSRNIYMRTRACRQSELTGVTEQTYCITLLCFCNHIKRYCPECDSETHCRQQSLLLYLRQTKDCSQNQKSFEAPEKDSQVIWNLCRSPWVLAERQKSRCKDIQMFKVVTFIFPSKVGVKLGSNCIVGLWFFNRGRKDQF